MSHLKYVHKLLDGVDVAWMPLADVVEFKRGEQLKPVNIIPGTYPIVTASKTEVGAHSEWNFGPISVTVTSHGAYAGHVNYWPTPIWLANNVFLLSPIIQLNQRFLYFFLKSNESKIQGLAKGGGIPYFNTRDLAPLLVPIPCPENPPKSLEIQGEIVRILDTFTELTTELTAELTARKKQYNHYRDLLLSFDDGEVEWKTLGEMTVIKTGQSVNKQMISENPGHYPVLNSGKEPLGFIDEWNVSDDPIGITSRGAGVGSITWAEGKYFRGNLNYSATIRDKTTLRIRYLYHLLQKMQPEIQALCTYDGIPALNAGSLKELLIPIPELPEQDRIAHTLDKFDALTNSLTEGLPREIELRQKQYAYYRDLLLSFPKSEGVEA
ncbi:restriction endonuclease subunit S [Azohydromonas lata]|uniref:Restriction endonuclease subunit S n=1 Tax=Azohydromonas lata TaxID=45677 RepID=A0ABU5I9Y8_9BURK|nr:restriction endonuclease subunit S [Azohydromonas lata]MDZ5455783.1 restriction endonuclease subunit S [Azohydromonas lata]